MGDLNHESLLETESKIKKKMKRTEPTNENEEECNEYIPIKQNKKTDIEYNEGDDDTQEYDNNSLLKIARSSHHFIQALVDADAQNEGDDDSISDLSDGFDENGETIDLKASNIDNSRKAI